MHSVGAQSSHSVYCGLMILVITKNGAMRMRRCVYKDLLSILKGGFWRC